MNCKLGYWALLFVGIFLGSAQAQPGKPTQKEKRVPPTPRTQRIVQETDHQLRDFTKLVNETVKELDDVLRDP